MKISELINHLQTKLQELGDINTYVFVGAEEKIRPIQYIIWNTSTKGVKRLILETDD